MKYLAPGENDVKLVFKHWAILFVKVTTSFAFFAEVLLPEVTSPLFTHAKLCVVVSDGFEPTDDFDKSCCSATAHVFRDVLTSLYVSLMHCELGSCVSFRIFFKTGTSRCSMIWL